MKRSRFTEERIIAILREPETGVVAALRRKRGPGSPTFHKWKAQYGSLDVSEAAAAGSCSTSPCSVRCPRPRRA